jgi:hypothetical protein
MVPQDQKTWKDGIRSLLDLSAWKRLGDIGLESNVSNIEHIDSTAHRKQQGDVVNIVCNDKLAWLGLQKGDSFLITVTHVEEYNSWQEMLSDSTLENLLPIHVLSRGRQKKFKQDDALEVYQRLFYWPLTGGRNGAMRFDVRTHTIDNK